MIRKTLREYKNKLLFVVVLAWGLPLAFIIAFFVAFKDRVYPNVSVCRYPLSGKNQQEVSQYLSSFLDRRFPGRIILSYENWSFSLNLDSLQYSPLKTGQKAFVLARETNPLLKLKTLWQLMRQGQNLVFDYSFEEKQLESQIAGLTTDLNQPAINPEIKVNIKGGQKTISVETGKDGKKVNEQELKKRLLEALSCPSPEINLNIPLTFLSPQVSLTQALETQKRAEKLLGKAVELKLENQSWTVDDEEIISLLSFTVGLNQDKITRFTANLAQTINTEPENATFQFENNRVFVFRPSKDGIALKEQEFTDDFTQALFVLETTGQNQKLDIPVTKKPAKISTADVNSLGIKELLGLGTSSFRGSNANRIHNLTLASLKLKGILIPPGEIFSFNRALGDVSAATGYKQAYIIKEGKTILGDGGGVCQVSTTLFRTALKTGLPILERQPHAYRVSYYEQDLGPGFDATVFSPSPDLKFKNNTPAYLLVQTKVDNQNQKLVFELYGTSDGRKVAISRARVWDRTPPPPDLYLDDPTLPAGKITQIEHKIWGAKVAFDYKVTQGEEILENKTFTSYYRPWQAVYLRGIGR